MARRRGRAWRPAAALAAAATACLAFAAAGAPPDPAATVTPATEPAELAPAATGGATPAPPSFGTVLWTELRYSAHKFFLGASTSLRVERVSAETLASLLRRPPKARPVPVTGRGAVALSMDSDLPFGRDERVTLWLDPDGGAALGGEKTVTGGSAYHKLLRYTEGGLYTWRSEPASAREERLAPERWTRRNQYLSEPAVHPPADVPVTDAYALLYLVSAARLDREDGALRFVMFDDKADVELSFAAGSFSRIRAAFDESWPGGNRRREGEVQVRSVRATGRAFGASQPQSDVDLGFLGMRGTLTLYVEVGTGIPIAFSGRAEHIGNLTVRLDRVVLAAPPAPDSNP